MMPKYRILIVEDQSDVRRMLRSGLETLGSGYEVVDIPSGEEAFLDLRHRDYHLLIADVRLAGMTGIELKRKAQELNPDLKVILITGITDPKFRRQVADAGADAFFFKPIQLNNLLTTVERLLDWEEIAPHEPGAASAPAERALPTGLVARLAALRDELKAISAVLFDENGNVLARLGDLPDAAIKSDLMPVLLDLLNKGTRISQSLGKESPEDLYCISGGKYNLSLTHINAHHTLLVVTNTGPGSEYLGTIGFSLHVAAQDLCTHLTLPEPAVERTETPDKDSEIDIDTPDQAEEPELPGSLPDIDDIFQVEEAENLKTEDVDAFWDSLLEESDPDIKISSSDSISYTEALDLGITPEKDQP